MFIALMTQLWKDEAGFIVSAEMVLIGTITVLGMVVGLSEVSFNVNKELGDVAQAFGSINQTTSLTASAPPQFNGNEIICDVSPSPEGY